MTDPTSSVSHLDLEESNHTFLDANELVINMGPQHPATHGVLRVILRLDGEKVMGLECVIGYLHRGVEKIAEHRTYTMFNPYVDRMDYVAAVSNGLGYCEAVEKLLNIEAPPRANFIRVILTELNRLASHQLWLGTHALDIGAMSVFLYCFREREDVLRLFEMVSGQRMMTSYFRIGGLALEPPIGFFDRVKRFLDLFPARIDEYEDLLTQNPIWVERTRRSWLKPTSRVRRRRGRPSFTPSRSTKNTGSSARFGWVTQVCSPLAMNARCESALRGSMAR